ncbi:MAG: hypothetical protein LBQ24_03560 [Candidatus Peribacteria bacterium]|nr:hypothetical protein [Candidatus Peribacteria bacterium]
MLFSRVNFSVSLTMIFMFFSFVSYLKFFINSFRYFPTSSNSFFMDFSLHLIKKPRLEIILFIFSIEIFIFSNFSFTSGSFIFHSISSIFEVICISGVFNS